MGKHLIQQSERCRVIGEAVAGTSHQQRGLPCQDATCWKLLPNGCVVLAVADGAGSASRSEVGSTVAVEAAVDAITRLHPANDLWQSPDWHEVARSVFQEALAAVASEAQTRNIPVRELASTLIFAIANDNWVAAAQIGDGAVVVSLSEEVVLLTLPPSVEYLNETTFLTSPDAFSQMQCCVLPGPVSHVALFTDGMQHLALTRPFNRPHTPFFLPLFSFLDRTSDLTEARAELQAFLASARVQEKTDDDTSLVLATFPPDPSLNNVASQG